MQKKNLKPSATALNEVTLIILDLEKKESFHSTKTFDLSKHNIFRFVDSENTVSYYNVPKGKVTHYHPSFWNFPVKLAFFFERHKTLAFWLDWFRMRKKAIYEVGFIYEKGKPDPLKAERPQYDFAQENWNIRHNTIIERKLKKDGQKLNREKPDHTSLWVVAMLLVVVIIAVGVMVYLYTGNGNTQPIQNATATIAPTIGVIHP